jgi:hypothetical protein
MFNISLCKDDPNCQITVPLLSTWCLEDSIDTLNFNLTSLDVATCNLLYSAVNFYDPFTSIVQQNSAKFIQASDWIEQNGDKVEGAATTVNMLSSQWLTPISIIYKDVLDSHDEATVRAWVNANFPQYFNNCLNYINGQKLFVYSLKYAHINRENTQKITVPGYVFNYQYTVRVISRVQVISTPVQVPPKVIDASYTCQDQYVGDVIGYEYCLTNGTWNYIGLIHGYD